MKSSIAAKVVLLPEPVAPVTSTRPRRALLMLRSTSLPPSASREGMLVGTVRKAAPTPRL